MDVRSLTQLRGPAQSEALRLSCLATSGAAPARQRRQRHSCGISLLEVLMAIALLGISFATIFSGLSAALRATDRLSGSDRATAFATQKLNELYLDPSLQAGQVRSGVSPSGVWWEARTQAVGTRPWSDPKRPIQLLRIDLEISWPTRLGRQSLSLETLKLCIPQPQTSP
jgi:type II secretory pathway pseudopilin PulG